MVIGGHAGARGASISLDDVGQRPLQLAAEAASLNQRVIGPVADGEVLVTTRTLLIAQSDFAIFLGWGSALR